MKKELSDKIIEDEDPYEFMSSDFVPIIGILNFNERTCKEYNFNRDIVNFSLLYFYNLAAAGLVIAG